MKFKKLKVISAATILTLMSWHLGAQEGQQEQVDPKDETTQGQQPMQTPEIIQQIVDDDRASWLGEDDVLGYDRGGRRDPFVPLIRDRGPRQQAQGDEPVVVARPRPPGIAGMDIAEIDLVGVVMMENRIIAHFNGSDNFGYFLNVGDEVYDGIVSEIQEDRVVFEQRLTSTQGIRSRQVVKKLRSTINR